MRTAYHLAFLFFFAAGSRAAQLEPPAHLASGPESGRVVAIDDDGNQRWTSVWTMENGTADGQPIVRMTEVGSGEYSGFDGEIRWRTDTVWLREGGFRPLESEKTFRDANDAPVATMRTEFDWENSVVRFERDDLRTGESERESRELPSDTLFVEGIAAALRSLPFDAGDSVDGHLFTPEPELYDVTFEVRGIETLTTPEGVVEAYKVEVVPRLGLLTVFRFLAPKTHFWFADDPTSTWIRYEGPENGRGTPTITMSRVVE